MAHFQRSNMIFYRSAQTLLRLSRMLVRQNIATSLTSTTSRQIRCHNSKPQPKHLTPTTAHQILASQRLRRPTAPHLAIYKWQITSVLSSLERITGLLVASSIYIIGIAYVASPFLGWDMSSTSIAAAFGAWPVAAKITTKFLVAFPFTLHAFNGVRLLIWDCALLMAKGQVVKTGWLAVGAAGVSAVWLAVL